MFERRTYIPPPQASGFVEGSEKGSAWPALPKISAHDSKVVRISPLWLPTFPIPSLVPRSHNPTCHRKPSACARNRQPIFSAPATSRFHVRRSCLEPVVWQHTSCWTWRLAWTAPCAPSGKVSRCRNSDNRGMPRPGRDGRRL